MAFPPDPLAVGSADVAQVSTVVLAVSRRDAQSLYDHIGTMPWAHGSWSNNLRSVLSEALHDAQEDGPT